MKFGLPKTQMFFALAFLFLSSNIVLAQKLPQQLGTKEATMKDEKPKFEELLDTKDLSKFRGYQTEQIGPGWSLKGKEISFDGTGEGDLVTVDKYTDFDLQVEWMVEKGGNSGIMFRVTLGDDQPYLSGPEFQILDDANAKDGASELTSAGALYGLYPAKDKKLSESGKWNKSKIVVQGEKITHYLNGKKVVEAESGSADWNQRLANSKFKDWEKFNQSKEGHIAFQNHGDPVKFRNIRIKRLGVGESADEENASGAGIRSIDP